MKRNIQPLQGPKDSLSTSEASLAKQAASWNRNHEGPMEDVSWGFSSHDGIFLNDFWYEFSFVWFEMLIHWFRQHEFFEITVCITHTCFSFMRLRRQTLHRLISSNTPWFPACATISRFLRWHKNRRHSGSSVSQKTGMLWDAWHSLFWPIGWLKNASRWPSY